MIPGLRYSPAFNAGAAASAGLSMSLLDTANSTSNTITVPPSALAGDWAILFSASLDIGGGTVSAVTPSGWTTLANKFVSGTDSARSMVHCRTLTGSPGGTIITGMNESNDYKIMLVFRPSTSIVSVTTPAWTEEGTTGNPSAQAVTVAAVATPLIVFAMGFSSVLPAFSTETPSMTNLTKGSGAGIRVGYTVYNSSPSNQSIDIGDGGDLNTLQSGYVRFT